ncbi:hypothetical protein PHMEG_00018627, partial [Phytophthora megakarya]
RADCPHLAGPEWEALQRLSTDIGVAAVATMLRTLSPTEQHGVALGFILSEQCEVAAVNTVSPGVTPRNEYLKLHVSNYEGKEGETLLRWLVALDTAIMARRIVDPLSKVAFAMSCLGGRARSWAYDRRLADLTCFSTYESFRMELKLAFEHPKKEFRSRAEFLDLQQGTQDVHAYTQRARYLVSNGVTKPMDETTKVSTVEAAITLAMQEKFSLRQAKLHVNVPLPPEPAVEVADEVEGPESMDLSSATAAGQHGTRSNVRCFRCGNIGHYARAGCPTGNAVTRVYNGHARIIHARLSYKHRVVVEELLVLDLDEKFDMVLGMPWLARLILLSTGRSLRPYASDAAAQQRAMALLVQRIHLMVHPNLQ